MYYNIVDNTYYSSFEVGLENEEYSATLDPASPSAMDNLLKKGPPPSLDARRGSTTPDTAPYYSTVDDDSTNEPVEDHRQPHGPGDVDEPNPHNSTVSDDPPNAGLSINCNFSFKVQP